MEGVPHHCTTCHPAQTAYGLLADVINLGRGWY